MEQIRSLLPGILALTAGLGLCSCGIPLSEDKSDDPGGTVGAASSGHCQGAPYPIVLAHGMAGWDKIGGSWNYFFQVADDLRHGGEHVVTPQVSPFDDSIVRGTQLAQAIDDTLKTYKACKVNIIAHSQGGLDARYAVSSLHYGDRVASLVTISTPHRGSPVADAALGLLPGFGYGLIDAVLQGYASFVGVPKDDPALHAQLRQLSSDELLSSFNPGNPDDRRVAYYSVAGRSAARIGNEECRDGLWENPQRFDLLDPLFGPLELVFAAVSPDPLSSVVNDGLVTIDSARWGRFLGCVPADHLDEIGQFFHTGTDLVSGYNHEDMYRRIVAQLHHDGF